MRWPLLLLAFVTVAFGLDLAVTYPQLPERVATHFNAAGQPNGWMTRPQHLGFLLGLGLGLPFTIIAVFYVMRFFPAAYFNLPHRDYWLAPERRTETMSYLLSHAVWFASLSLVFVASIHHLILAANQTPPVQLSTPYTFTAVGFFLAGLLWWSVSLLWHFRQKP